MMRALLRRWRRDLGRQGYRVRCGELFDGWVRIIVDLSPARALVTLIPIDFPERAPQHHVVDKSTGLYLEEGTCISITSGTASKLTFSVSYEEIN